MRTYLTGTFDRVEHGMGVVRFADGQELKIAKDELHPVPEIGSEVGVTVAPIQEMELQKEVLAKELLNQLLGN